MEFWWKVFKERRLQLHTILLILSFLIMYEYIHERRNSFSYTYVDAFLNHELTILSNNLFIYFIVDHKNIFLWFICIHGCTVYTTYSHINASSQHTIKTWSSCCKSWCKTFALQPFARIHRMLQTMWPLLSTRPKVLNCWRGSKTNCWRGSP